MAGKGGGAWKVAYADFVTAMMAFFMVMWLTSQSSEVKQAVASYFRDPYSLEEGNPTGDNKGRMAPPRLRGDPRPEKPGGSIAAGPMLEDWLSTEPRVSVTFDPDGATLTDEQRKLLREMAPELTGKRHRIEVRAHCLRKPLPPESPFKDHWDMCYARCRVVMDELEGAGVDLRLMRASQAEGNEPITTTLRPEEIAKNSRVDVYLLPNPVDLE